MRGIFIKLFTKSIYRYFLLLLLVTVIFNSCGSPASNHNNQKPNNKEEHFADSTASDSNYHTTPILTSAISGLWVVSMKCIETDCEGSAIGDIKTERWDISINNGTLTAEAKVNETLSRLYVGQQRGEFYELSLKPSNNSNNTQAKMLVKLKPLSNDHMEGTREIFRDDCHIVYSLELNKQ